MNFYVGLHIIAQAWRFERCMISVKRLQDRKSDFRVNEWILDSGAFTELKDYGHYRDTPDKYAAQIRRWSRCGNLVAAVSQDYMCEPIVISGGTVNGMVFVGTKLSVPEHQRLTIERYDTIKPLTGNTYLMPVLQGYYPDEYLSHLEQYGDRLEENQWVGVGSVCKRNSKVESVEQILMTIKERRPDLRLHGFGLKTTALESSVVRRCLYSADSMAWSYAARRSGRDANSHVEAANFSQAIDNQEVHHRDFQKAFFDYLY